MIKTNVHGRHQTSGGVAVWQLKAGAAAAASSCMCDPSAATIQRRSSQQCFVCERWCCRAAHLSDQTRTSIHQRIPSTLPHSPSSSATAATLSICCAVSV